MHVGGGQQKLLPPRDSTSWSCSCAGLFILIRARSARGGAAIPRLRLFPEDEKPAKLSSSDSRGSAGHRDTVLEPWNDDLTNLLRMPHRGLHNFQVKWIREWRIPHQMLEGALSEVRKLRKVGFSVGACLPASQTIRCQCMRSIAKAILARLRSASEQQQQLLQQQQQEHEEEEERGRSRSRSRHRSRSRRSSSRRRRVVDAVSAAVVWLVVAVLAVAAVMVLVVVAAVVIALVVAAAAAVVLVVVSVVVFVVVVMLVVVMVVVGWSSSLLSQS